jgi:hypothetical protein
MLETLAAVIVALIAAFFYGDRRRKKIEDVRRTERELRARIDGLETRQEVEDAVSEDPDLAARARRLGLVRDPRR